MTPLDSWLERARSYERSADQSLVDGGPLTEWWETYNGLTTYSEMALYCYLQHEAGTP